MDNEIDIPAEDELDDDLYEDSSSANLGSLVVASRDWTVETIVSQINKENIDLNPKFQRRNAWQDDKRSRLMARNEKGHSPSLEAFADSRVEPRE